MTRLSPQQLEQVQMKAQLVHKRLVQVAKRKVPQQASQGAFFATLFHLAAQGIEEDVEAFCDRAEATFEEIEAHGQEPTIDIDWLREVTGEKDSFNFSTENLVSNLVNLPKRKRKKRGVSQEEKERIRGEVQDAIIDDEPMGVEQALAVAHGENVQGWIVKIKGALTESSSGMMEFWMLRDKTGLQPVELFLGVLLGQEYWRIGQNGFYETLWIEMKGQKKGRGERTG